MVLFVVTLTDACLRGWLRWWHQSRCGWSYDRDRTCDINMFIL